MIEYRDRIRINHEKAKAISDSLWDKECIRGGSLLTGFMWPMIWRYHNYIIFGCYATINNTNLNTNYTNSAHNKFQLPEIDCSIPRERLCFYPSANCHCQWPMANATVKAASSNNKHALTNMAFTTMPAKFHAQEKKGTPSHPSKSGVSKQNKRQNRRLHHVQLHGAACPRHISLAMKPPMNLSCGHPFRSVV